ncbi:hypothetical protein NC651_026496 [Populus alba x Populus x berolinensis]|nr:hypothetical protein NC651_026496 [Populus alba x Populus x berolinensis]
MQREANGGPLAHIQTPALQNKPTPYPSPPMHRPHHCRTPEATSSAIGLSPLTRFLHHSPESYLHSLSCDKFVMFRICISIHRSFVYQRMIAWCQLRSYQIYHLSFLFFVKLKRRSHKLEALFLPRLYPINGPIESHNQMKYKL